MGLMRVFSGSIDGTAESSRGTTPTKSPHRTMPSVNFATYTAALDLNFEYGFDSNTAFALKRAGNAVARVVTERLP
jgi:hypothetical protein